MCLGRGDRHSAVRACRSNLRMRGELIGLKSALFGSALPFCSPGPHMGANMAWKRDMSSVPHHACHCVVSNGVSEGKWKKYLISSLTREPCRLGAAVIRIPRPSPVFLSEFSPLLPVIVFLSGPASSNSAPLKSSFLRQKGLSFHNRQLGPFLPLSHSFFFFFKLSDRAGRFNLLEAQDVTYL